METNQIMHADILDILFDGRNKDYGAYDLRKTYNRRIVKALFVTAAVILLLFLGYFVSNGYGGAKKKPMNVEDVQLANVKEEKVAPPVIPPPVKLPPPRVEMIRVTPPRVVPDDQVKPEEKPPENDKLDDVKIGANNVEGTRDDGILAPPVSDAGKGVIAAPPKDDDNDGKPFMKVEVESTFPGGMGAWQRFLNKNLRYPDDALNNEIQGAVMVQFIVDKDGNVSDIEAVSGPDKGGLREEAVRVIKKSGKWTPALQNGKYVKSYKRQPVTFSIGGQ